ncbi:MAG TPA: hypothetical protein VFJ24_04025 [Gaiellales bacterium]|jgi:hypothetical protein|nr:hypothetical protein [Gemmatimonadales bacterium]HET7379191.1 hypothetical protein [Gaiellales bacterium]
MFRSILGFAIFAVLVWIGLKLIFGLLGGLMSILMTVLWLAAIGFIFYVVLRVISPSTADRVRDTIRGKRDAA